MHVSCPLVNFLEITSQSFTLLCCLLHFWESKVRKFMLKHTFSDVVKGSDATQTLVKTPPPGVYFVIQDLHMITLPLSKHIERTAKHQFKKQIT